MVDPDNKNKQPKPWYKSKTIYASILQVAGGLMLWASGEIAAGSTLTLSGIVHAALRIATKQGVSLN